VTAQLRRVRLAASSLTCDSPILIDGNLSPQNIIAKRYRLGPTGLFVLTIGPFGFSFPLSYLPAHLRDLLLHSFLGHKERTEQVPTQIEKVRNRLE
jgi:hypothetical protein